MMHIISARCRHCGKPHDPIDLLGLPVEPLYDLRVAVLLIPMPYETLRKFLARHPTLFKKRYRLKGRAHRKVRLLSAGEIQLIRDMALRGEGPRITPRSMATALTEAGKE